MERAALVYRFAKQKFHFHSVMSLLTCVYLILKTHMDTLDVELLLITPFSKVSTLLKSPQLLSTRYRIP